MYVKEHFWAAVIYPFNHAVQNTKHKSSNKVDNFWGKRKLLHGNEVDFTHICLEVGCSLCSTAALPTISHNNNKNENLQIPKQKNLARDQIILKMRCKCIEGGNTQKEKNFGFCNYYCHL